MADAKRTRASQTAPADATPAETPAETPASSRDAAIERARELELKRQADVVRAVKRAGELELPKLGGES